MRESTIEHRVTQYARKQGWLSYKFSSPARRAVPDRMYLKDGQIWFVEFKAPGKKPSKAQAHEHKKIEAHGGWVEVVDNIADGIALFDECSL